MVAFRRVLPVVIFSGAVAVTLTPQVALGQGSGGAGDDNRGSVTAMSDGATIGKAASEHQGQLADQLRTKAKQQLKQARTDLAAAQRQAARLRRQADVAARNAVTARRDLGNFARQAYATGSTDMLSWASLVDSPDPAAAIRRAEMAEMVAEHQDSQVTDAVAIAGRADDLRRQSTEILAAAHQRVRTAEQLLSSLQGNRNVMGEVYESPAGQDGTAQLARRCLQADVVVSLCGKPPWGERNLTFDSVVVERTVHLMWPQIRDVGGWRPSDPYPDHPSGRATDIMMPHQGHTHGDVALGNKIARYFQRNADEYGLYYMIWRQRIWKAGSPVGQWSSMSNRGDWTSNHMDHVHISVTNGRSGHAFEEALLLAQDQQAPLSR